MSWPLQPAICSLGLDPLSLRLVRSPSSGQYRLGICSGCTTLYYTPMRTAAPVRLDCFLLLTAVWIMLLSCLGYEQIRLQYITGVLGLASMRALYGLCGYLSMSIHVCMWQEMGSHLICILQGIMHIQVVALVTQPEQIRSDESNTFHFVFSTALIERQRGLQHGKASPRKLKRVLPGTKEEALSILQFAPECELPDC